MSLFKRNTQTSSAWNEYPTVTDFASLPPAADNAGVIYIVTESSGIWFVNYHEAGLYRSNGAVWQYIGSAVETTSIRVGSATVVGSPVVLNAGANINLSVDLPTKTITISSTGTSTGGGSVYFPEGW